MTITDPFEVIAAFVDGERVDPARLKSALATPDGRDYLADMVALREVVAHDLVPAAHAPARSTRRWIVATAAAVVLSLAGGYSLGHRSAPGGGAPALGGAVRSSASDAAPAPTRVIEVAPGSSYVTKGGE